jgi:hypothetical protein
MAGQVILSKIAMITRRKFWQKHLSEIRESRAHEPFRWGTNDCCMWAADAVLAMTGIDFAADFRGSYDDVKSAARLMSSLGGIEALTTKALGEPVSTMFASVGDVVLVDQSGQTGLGICNGSTVLVVTAYGLGAVGMNLAYRAWKI